MVHRIKTLIMKPRFFDDISIWGGILICIYASFVYFDTTTVRLTDKFGIVIFDDIPNLTHSFGWQLFAYVFNYAFLVGSIINWTNNFGMALDASKKPWRTLTAIDIGHISGASIAIFISAFFLRGHFSWEKLLLCGYTANLFSYIGKACGHVKKTLF
ncbi:MAG: hypothetical protein K0U23_02810 [Gammaproteobacteria bacterium]|nr:hypothetical protein [Gammaproteobacteria bacterium]